MSVYLRCTYIVAIITHITKDKIAFHIKVSNISLIFHFLRYFKYSVFFLIGLKAVMEIQIFYNRYKDI